MRLTILTYVEMTDEVRVRVVEEVWIATCLLHLDFPDRLDFSVDEISLRTEQERITEKKRSSASIRTHVSLHCVANKPSNSCNVRYLYETSRGRRRLFNPADPFHDDRKDGQQLPRTEELPDRYKFLLGLHWLKFVGLEATEKNKGLLELIRLPELGNTDWLQRTADEHVAMLRSNWT